MANSRMAPAPTSAVLEREGEGGGGPGRLFLLVLVLASVDLGSEAEGLAFVASHWLSRQNLSGAAWLGLSPQGSLTQMERAEESAAAKPPARLMAHLEESCSPNFQIIASRRTGTLNRGMM